MDVVVLLTHPSLPTLQLELGTSPRPLAMVLQSHQLPWDTSGALFGCDLNQSNRIWLHPLACSKRGC